jgi:F-type H+-transporting ATPase subunit gamma
LSTRPYAAKLNELFSHVISVTDFKSNDFISDREVKSRLIVAITSDRGMCGAFNTNLLKYTLNYINQSEINTKLITIGRKATDFFKKRNFDIINSYNYVFNDLAMDTSNKIVDVIVDGYKNKNYDKVVIIFNEFKSVVKQNIVKMDFLPFKFETVSKGKAENRNTQIDYIFEPDAKEILEYLIPKQLNIQFLKALLESNAAEQGARMTSMETATNNAADLIKELGIVYNKARQASITTELLEIVAGAEALQKG